MELEKIKFFEPTYELHITEDFRAQLSGKVPNRFHRWMLRVFFGFKIEVLTLDDKDEKEFYEKSDCSVDK